MNASRPFLMAVGASENVDGADAANGALDLALEQLDGLPPRAALVFAGIGVDARAALDSLAPRLGDVPLVGGTSTAEVSSLLGATEGSIVVALLAGDQLEVGAGLGVWREDGIPEPDELRGAAQAAAAQALESLHGPPRLCLCFGFGRFVDPSAVHEATVQALGPDVPVLGGNLVGEVGGADMYGETFFGTEKRAAALALLLIGGDLQVVHSVAHGWTPVSEAHTVTRVDGTNILLEVDGKPALDLYNNYLGTPGGIGVMFTNYPIAVDTPDGRLLRSAYTMGPVPGSIVLAGGINEGDQIRLCEFDRASVLAAAQEAIASALARWEGPPPSAALVFECLTRWIVLGTWAKRSTDLVRESLPAGTSIAGAYLGGEYAPFTPGGRGHAHNCSIVILLIGAA